MRWIVYAGCLWWLACSGSGEPSPVQLAPAEPPALQIRSASEAIAANLAHSDYVPSAAALALEPVPTPNYQTIERPLVVQSGEIVLMEGDASTVSALGNNEYGIVMTAGVQNPIAITKRFFQDYADEFDAVCVFTTFPDAGADEGSVAWHLSVRQSVKGIGEQLLDSGPWWGGEPGGQLHGFINMQYIGKYGSGLDNPGHWIHMVAAHEFAHRWLVHVRYVDNNGTISDRLLGRQVSHWAAGVHASGSVMDGHNWVALDSGKFWLKNKEFHYSELDQYLMGLRPAEEVPDFYVINDLVWKGNTVDPAGWLPTGVTVQGTREDVTMDQILAAHGDRIPDHTTSQKDFRIALVLLTRPGESTDNVTNFVERLEEFRHTFEQQVNWMSGGRVRVCTQVSAPCDAAGVTMTDIRAEEHEGNGDGVVDPGEIVAIRFSVKSTGFGDAPDVRVEVEEPSIAELNIITPTVELGDIPEGGSVEAPEPVLIKIPPFVPCGAEVRVPLSLHTDGRAFPAEIHFDVGVLDIVMDRFERPDEWTIDPDGTDTAKAGAWEIADPKGVDAYYIGVNLVTQPSQDHSVEGVNALVTGAEAGHIGDHDVDNGVTTALSPVYDVSTARDPMLTWYTWHFAQDFHSSSGVVPVENDALRTQLSVDGGEVWYEIQTDTSHEQTWIRNEVRLLDVAPFTGQVQLKFIMSDDPVQSLAEAAVDDIRIWDRSQACEPLAPPVHPQEEPEGSPEPPSSEEPEEEEVTEPVSPAAQPTDGGSCQAGSRGQGGAPVVLLLCVMWMWVVVRAQTAENRP